MNEPRLEDLMYRIEVLDHLRRRWKMIALVALATVLFLVILGGLMSASTAVLGSRRYAVEMEMMRDEMLHQQRAAEAARQGAEAARRQAEVNLQEAERKRQLAEEALEKLKRETNKP